MKSVLLAILLVAQVNAFAQATGAVAGRLRNPDGLPAAGVRVGAAEIDGAGTESLSVMAVTNDSGQYRLEGLKPGQYKIVAGALAVPTYYPGTADAAAARLVNVRSDATVQDLDFTVTSSVGIPVGVVRFSAALNAATIEVGTRSSVINNPRFPVVSGRIVIEGLDQPPNLAGLRVRIGMQTAAAAQDGSFSPPVNYFEEPYVSVPALGERLLDDYYLKSIVYGTTDLLKNPLKIDLTTSREILVTLVQGVSVSGNVRTESGAPANMTVYLISNLSADERPDLPRRANTDSEGNFVLRGVAPGEYVLFSESLLNPLRQSIPIAVTNARPGRLNLTLGPGRSLLARPQ